MSDNNVSRKQFLGMLGGLVGTVAASSLLPIPHDFTGGDNTFGNRTYGGA